jgi:hypothetical protein
MKGFSWGFPSTSDAPGYPLPVDTSILTVLCGGAPGPVVDRETGEHKTNRDGIPLFRTDLVVMGQGRPEVVGVRTAKEPKGLVVGTTG